MLKKRKTLGFIILSIIDFITFLALIFYPIYSLSITFFIMAVANIILYFISNNINLVFLGIFDTLLYAVPIFLINILTQTNLYTSLYTYDYNNVLLKNMAKQSNGIYKVSSTKIVDNENNIVLDWIFFGNFVDNGTIEVQDGNIGYEIQLKDKCLIKNIDKKEYKIITKKCDDIND